MITTIILACVVGGIVGIVGMFILIVLTALCKYVEYHPEATPNDAIVTVFRLVLNDLQGKKQAK